MDECVGKRFHRLLEMRYDSIFVGGLEKRCGGHGDNVKGYR